MPDSPPYRYHLILLPQCVHGVLCHTTEHLCFLNSDSHAEVSALPHRAKAAISQDTVKLKAVLAQIKKLVKESEAGVRQRSNPEEMEYFVDKPAALVGMILGHKQRIIT